ncbi:hypothetical protein G3576_08070 [Roseomonas stagni]|uniref:Cell division protein FtsL n=1 Tax=Falsiroseomonas algicola TaxID=2716930 RepID=A0A6M1LHZ3_9PROT|nr:hypothetical protein [Falsiroseomonas algicola]NGM19968.1 hypothetical protein [Falsiroseomonas algicola]
MIRPFTIVCFVAFAGAGAWLYQVKHHVATYDRELRDVRRQTEQMRDRISILRAEWALLNEPDRLRQVATRHLPLEPMQPTQFARATEMERRLPQAVAFAGPPNLFAPPEAPRQAGNVMVAAAQVPAPAPPAAPAARPQPAAAPAPTPSRPAPAADPRAPEAPALQALAATVAAQRATQTAVPPPAPPRPAPLRDVAPRAPSPTLAQLTPGVIRQATAAPVATPVAQPRPAAPAPVQAEPVRVARSAPPPAPAPAPAPPTFVSALGGGSSLGRPALAPPVPFGSASAATLGGLAPPQPR